MATSTRSTPSPPPAGPNSISVSVSHASNGNAQFRSRRGRNSVPAGLTPIRPSLDYSTTNSYLGGESTVGNDTTTDGETFVIQSFGRPRRSSTMSSTASKPTIDINPADTQETRAHRVVPRHGRESPHPQNGANSRGAGPIPMSPHFSYLLPDKLYLGSSINLDARQMSEHSLLSIAVLIAAWQLLTVGESNAAMMLLVLVVCSLVYEYGTPVSTYLFPPKSEPLSPNANGPERPNRRPKVVVTAHECTDNGESTATLLGPLVVASALFAAKHTIASVPLAANWHMEGPLPLQEQHYSRESLVSSRRGFLQCTFLNTLVLLVHMYSASSRRNWPKPENTPHGGRQVLLFVVFAVCLTAASTAIYEVDRVMQLGFWDGALIALYVSVRLARRALTLGELAFIGHGATALFLETLNISIIKQWPHSAAYVKTFREPSPLLVFQLALLPGSILVGFLLSPLLALSRHIARRPRLRLRAPHQTEQLIYRRMLAIGLAAGAVLLVGGLLGGWVRWLLGARDPWLWVLRSLTQGRRSWSRLTLVSWWGLLGSLSVAGWNRQLARSRRHPHINAYTSVTARPPSQSHFKQKLPPTPTSMSEVSAVGTYPPLVPRLGSLQAQAQSNGFKGTTTLLVPTRDIQAVATDLLDAANKHVPTLSRNGRRKFFHALAVLMFVPGISWDVSRCYVGYREWVGYIESFLSPNWMRAASMVRKSVACFGAGGSYCIGRGRCASIIGKRLGFSRWFPSSGKTLEGTIAFAVSVFLCNWMVAAQEFTSVNVSQGEWGRKHKLTKQRRSTTWDVRRVRGAVGVKVVLSVTERDLVASVVLVQLSLLPPSACAKHTTRNNCAVLCLHECSCHRPPLRWHLSVLRIPTR
ncbi:dolichol kinase [Rhizoctonia solani AG-1 IA]|uniref:dolichol kinase n=1 Tax=Thanatephorus cucumeris (strain AG1-IA) TaxID=983506 RepID=L8WUA4_THACA|nr:dolichol kinase [Rhizoctonia solani AG-1 IA]